MAGRGFEINGPDTNNRGLVINSAYLRSERTVKLGPLFGSKTLAYISWSPSLVDRILGQPVTPDLKSSLIKGNGSLIVTNADVQYVAYSSDVGWPPVEIRNYNYQDPSMDRPYIIIVG